MRFKLEFVPNARRCLRWFSVQIPAANLAFLGIWSALPERFQDALPSSWVMGIAATLIILGVIGRLIAQPVKEKKS